MGSGCRESEGAAEVEEASSGEHWWFGFSVVGGVCLVVVESLCDGGDGRDCTRRVLFG